MAGRGRGEVWDVVEIQNVLSQIVFPVLLHTIVLVVEDAVGIGLLAQTTNTRGIETQLTMEARTIAKRVS